MGGQVVSPLDLSRTLLVGGGLLVPCSLPGPPVIKQLMEMVVWPGWVVSISVLPLNNIIQLSTARYIPQRTENRYSNK